MSKCRAITLALFIAYSLQSVKGQTVKRCPAGTTQVGTTCFQVMREPQPWSAAQERCRSGGGDLASVENGLENDILQVLAGLAEADYIWLGLNDVESEAGTDPLGSWTWSRGEEYTFRNWLSAPSNQFSSQDCVLMQMTTGLWTNIASCRSMFKFACEFDMVDVPKPVTDPPIVIEPPQPQEPEPPAEAKSKDGCFTAYDRVVTPQGMRYMKDVRPGDLVLTVSPDSGKPFYDRVYLSAHHTPDTERSPPPAHFVTINTTSGSSVSVTGKHILHTESGMKPAEDIQLSDKLFTVPAGGGGGAGQYVNVEHIGTEPLPGGLYNPLTTSGLILVNDLLATVYADDIPPVTPHVAHALLWPIRVLRGGHVTTDSLLAGFLRLDWYSDQGYPMPLHYLEVARRYLMSHG